jgi:hypothetical protein
MGLRAFFERLEQLVGRFNRWFAPAALASGGLEGTTPEQADPGRVTTVPGELERPGADGREDERD